MNGDINVILGHTNLFKDPKNIKKIEKISSSKYKIIDYKQKPYVFGLYDFDELDNINTEVKVNEILEKAGLNPLQIYDKGLMPDINKSFKIFDYRDEISLKDYLERAYHDQKIKLAYRLGDALRCLHSVKPTDNIDWEKKFLVKTNNLFYIHGLNEVMPDDYIFVDFINANKHLTKNTAINLMYENISDKNIRVYDGDKLDLRAIKSLEYGDGIMDFLELNRIAINQPEFAKAVLNGYFQGEKPVRKFFRLLSLYQVTEIFENLIRIRMDKIHSLTTEEIESIMDMYNQFNNIVPSWAY